MTPDRDCGPAAGARAPGAADPGTYWVEHALLPTDDRGTRAASRVRLTVTDGRLTRVETSVDPDPADVTWRGVAVPGFANCHSHAFHRALRGRTHADGGTFWTWREVMYDVARRLDPDSYYRLARAVYAEMVLAGMTAVGEFHYLHHAPDGEPYEDANAMGEALRRAARDAGIRLTLLDTCYLHGGLQADGHTPLSEHQLRFSDGDVDAWVRRHRQLQGDENTVIGAAIHSVRAVAQGDLARITEATGDAPLHAHVSEQPAENDAARAHYGATPVGLLDAAGALGECFTAVHATHLSEPDQQLLGASRSWACFCPTTERDLADGIGPAIALLDHGARLSLGSDQHAVIDMAEEARALEMHERLTSHQRGRLTPAQLLDAATAHASIGWQDAGRLTEGARADVVVIGLSSPRTAGIDPEQVLYAATAADVSEVLVDGRAVVTGGRHHLGDVGALLAETIAELQT
ncbi:MAG: formimidoylglutamate deiminase [Brachybacterium sp.]|nr:formimidoylglutamate deiminase [Brachybacterium sp.]